MKNKTIREAYEHGKQAFTLGMSSRACPYTDAAHVQAWEDGFLHAKFSALQRA